MPQSNAVQTPWPTACTLRCALHPASFFHPMPEVEGWRSWIKHFYDRGRCHREIFLSFEWPFPRCVSPPPCRVTAGGWEQSVAWRGSLVVVLSSFFSFFLELVHSGPPCTLSAQPMPRGGLEGTRFCCLVLGRVATLCAIRFNKKRRDDTVQTLID